jgi:purine-binding chemotaxis protein CheW
MDDRNDSTSLERQIIAFHVAGEVFGLDITQIERIAHPETITLVPRAPAFVSGIMNLAGRIITVVDLALMMHMKRAEEIDGDQIIILGREDMNLGFVTGQVTDVITTNEESLNEGMVRMGSSEEQFVSAVLKLGDRIVNILNVDKLIDYINKSFVGVGAK